MLKYIQKDTFANVTVLLDECVYYNENLYVYTMESVYMYVIYTTNLPPAYPMCSYHHSNNSKYSYDPWDRVFL